MSVFARASSRHRQPFDPITAVLFKIIQAITYLFVLAVLFMNPESKQGIIDPKDVIFFLSLMGFTLFLNVVVLER